MEELSYAKSLIQKHREWPVQEQDGRNTIAESYGFGDEVCAITDLDGDGVETVYMYTAGRETPF